MEAQQGYDEAFVVVVVFVVFVVFWPYL